MRDDLCPRLDVAALRADTPGCRRGVHLNAAGSALMPAPVLQAVKGHLDLEASIGGYEAAEEVTMRLEACYEALARLLNATPSEIALFESGSRAWAAIVEAMDFRPGDRILVTETEYENNIISLQRLSTRVPIVVDVVPQRGDATIDVDGIIARLDDRVRLVSAVHVPTSNGLVNPVAELGHRLSGHPAVYLVDACQSLGQLPLDVRRIGCTALIASGRKYLRGPRGTGVAFIAEAQLPHLRRGKEHADRSGLPSATRARQLESWEANIAARLGLGAAAQYLLEIDIRRVWPRIAALGDEMRQGLRSIPGVDVLDRGDAPCGLVTFRVPGQDVEKLARHLRQVGIAVDVSWIRGTLFEHCMPGVDAALRASVHYYNTAEEIDCLLQALHALVGGADPYFRR